MATPSPHIDSWKEALGMLGQTARFYDNPPDLPLALMTSAPTQRRALLNGDSVPLLLDPQRKLYARWSDHGLVIAADSLPSSERLRAIAAVDLRSGVELSVRQNDDGFTILLDDIEALQFVRAAAAFDSHVQTTQEPIWVFVTHQQTTAVAAGTGQSIIKEYRFEGKGLRHGGGRLNEIAIRDGDFLPIPYRVMITIGEDGSYSPFKVILQPDSSKSEDRELVDILLQEPWNLVLHLESEFGENAFVSMGPFDQSGNDVRVLCPIPRNTTVTKETLASATFYAQLKRA